MEVLTVRLPMSPEAANEKLAEAAFAGGTIWLRNVGNVYTERISSTMAKGGTRLIQFAEGLPTSSY